MRTNVLGGGRHLLIEEGVPSNKNQVVAYKVVDNKILDIYPIKSENANETRLLPDMLVIDPGFYQIGGKTYDMNEIGLYRILNIEVQNHQRVVYDKKNRKMDAFISSLCWIVTHGNSDDKNDFIKNNQKALNDKLYLTCGSFSLWANKHLVSQGYNSRVVTSLTLDAFNGYDNGHTLIEVFDEKRNKWVLYDIDNNCFFEKNKNRMNFLELSDLINKKDRNYEVIYIANDIRLDVSNFMSSSKYSYNFFSEKITATEKSFKEWNERVLQVPMIYDEISKKYEFFDTRDIARVENYSTSYKYIEKDAFMKKFYQ